MEWNRVRVGQTVRAIRKLYVPAQIEIGTEGIVRDVRRPGNSMVAAVQVEWQVAGSPLYWCAGYEVELA